MWLAVKISPKFIIYAVDTDLGSSIFFNDVAPHDLEAALQKKSEEQDKYEVNKEK